MRKPSAGAILRSGRPSLKGRPPTRNAQTRYGETGCTGAPILELGCGTGRVAIPVAKAGATVIGIDRSESMLTRGRARVRRARMGARVKLIRGDIRYLPFPDKSFPLVMAPYGILQSLLDEKVLTATLKEVRRVLTREGHLRSRARRRSTGVGRVLQQGQPSIAAGSARQADRAD